MRQLNLFPGSDGFGTAWITRMSSEPPERNVEVLNDTADMYRYFDCTAEAEFL